MSFIAATAVVGAILLPPPELDHEPTIPVSVRTLPLAEIAEACRIDYAYACTLNLGGVCFVTLPNVGPGGVGARTLALLRRHEWGHCNQDHPSHEGYK